MRRRRRRRRRRRARRVRARPRRRSGGGGTAHGSECGAGGGAGARARGGSGGAGQRAGRAPEGCGPRSVTVRAQACHGHTCRPHALAAKAPGARSFARAVHIGCGQDRRAHLHGRGSRLGRPASCSVSRSASLVRAEYSGVRVRRTRVHFRARA
eukprot:877616-Prymnesium_polylepis.1